MPMRCHIFSAVKMERGIIEYSVAFLMIYTERTLPDDWRNRPALVYIFEEENDMISLRFYLLDDISMLCVLDVFWKGSKMRNLSTTSFQSDI